MSVDEYQNMLGMCMTLYMFMVIFTIFFRHIYTYKDMKKKPPEDKLGHFPLTLMAGVGWPVYYVGLLLCITIQNLNTLLDKYHGFDKEGVETSNEREEPYTTKYGLCLPTRDKMEREHFEYPKSNF